MANTNRYLVVYHSEYPDLYYENTDVDNRRSWVRVNSGQIVLENSWYKKDIPNAQVLSMIKAALEGRLEWRNRDAEKES